MPWYNHIFILHTHTSIRASNNIFLLKYGRETALIDVVRSGWEEDNYSCPIAFSGDIDVITHTILQGHLWEMGVRGTMLNGCTLSWAGDSR